VRRQFGAAAGGTGVDFVHHHGPAAEASSHFAIERHHAFLHVHHKQITLAASMAMAANNVASVSASGTRWRDGVRSRRCQPRCKGGVPLDFGLGPGDARLVVDGDAFARDPVEARIFPHWDGRRWR
jgi:hypothetical protein